MTKKLKTPAIMNGYIFHEIKKYALDLFFPIKCLGGCGTWDIWLCPKCQAKIIHPKQDGRLGYLDSYKNPLMQKIIWQLKYGYSQELALILSPLLNNLVNQLFDYAIPIPLHKKRLRERGFNQSALLCRSLSIPTLERAVFRNRYTPPQARLDEKQRRQNIKDCFSIPKKYVPILKNKKLLLVDDVYTTGSTMKECRCALKQAGAAEIWYLALAKG